MREADLRRLHDERSGRHPLPGARGQADAGSAGALVWSPHSITVGASGAIFGLLGAGMILEWMATGSIAGQYLTLIVINLVFTFAVPNISIGGHIGGLIAGALGVLVLARFGKGHPAYGRVGLVGYGG